MPLSKEELTNDLLNKQPKEKYSEDPVPSVASSDLFDFEPSFDMVPLPSKGLLYSEEHPFHNKNKVEIKAMTAHEENILFSEAYVKKGTVLNELLSSCLVDKSANPSSLLLGDKSALLLAVRISGFGPEYRVFLECPECSFKFKHEFDLSKVEIKHLHKDAKQIKAGKNLFEYTLPKTKATVHFSLLTDADDSEIQKMQQQRAKAMGNLGMSSEVDTTVTDKLVKSIQKIKLKNGKEVSDKSIISKAVMKLPSQDSNALRNHILKIEPDVNMNQLAVCKNPKCGVEEDYGIPLTTQFFWPTGD